MSEKELDVVGSAAAAEPAPESWMKGRKGTKDERKDGERVGSELNDAEE